MEFLLPSPAVIVGISASLLFLYHLLCMSRTPACHSKALKNRRAPEAAGAWPVIGHLPTVGWPRLLHITLGRLADKCGPLFTIKLGMRPALVVSDRELAKECFTANDRVFANRPQALAAELMGYNYAMFGLGPYGSYWRRVRKMVTLELLSNRRGEMFRHVQVSEVKASIKELHELWERSKSASHAAVLVEMRRWFRDLNVDIILRLLAGKRCTGDDEEDGLRFQKAMREFVAFMGIFLPSDSLPFLRWLDWGGYEKAMKKTAKELDHVLSRWLEEHKRRRALGAAKGDQDFMGVMLSLLEGAEAEDFSGRDADTINKSTCLAILSGGTETTTVSLIWALSLVLNNRHALKKAQDELDIRVGMGRQIEESDLKNLVYIQAIVKETLRLYPAAPLLVPHESMDDCTLGGYHVPAGTCIVVNCWKIHRDPLVWPDPSEFRPERFLTTHKDLDVRGQHFELIPFGSGRRMCPGISLTLQVMQLTLAYLLHGFELKTPSDEPVDMTESHGPTNLKATPLEVLLSPRLPRNLYG